MSLPEILLWRALEMRPGGLKVRKQHPAGMIVLDFSCAEAKLCVEVDGEAHDRGDQPACDENRDAWLRLHGVGTVRIIATDASTNIDGVVAQSSKRPMRGRPPLSPSMARA